MLAGKFKFGLSKLIFLNLFTSTKLEKLSLHSILKNYGKWEEDNKDKRYNFPMDFRFLKRSIKIGNFILLEKISVVQYPQYFQGNIEPCVIYERQIGVFNYSPIAIDIQKILNFFLRSYEERYDVKNTKYIKYPFIEKLFTDVVRDKKLESLGII